jgi:hypothetical protein
MAPRWIIRALLIAAGLAGHSAWGQPVPSREPTSTHIFPAGGKRGTSVKVRVGGECLPPGMNLQLLGASVTGSRELGAESKARYEPSLRRVPRDADDVSARIAYPREFDAQIDIAPDAAAGVRFWRVWGGWGGTRLRPFLVGDLPEFIENEPNSTSDQAERVVLPVVVNGQIAGERDQDFFVFSAKAGEKVTCDVMASRIGSPLEPVIAITDGQGQRVEYDESHVGGDPVVSFRAREAGDYRLHIANLGYFGGPAYVYRITIATGEFTAFAFPPVKAGDIPEMVEAAGNHSPQAAMALTSPSVVHGRFLKTDEEDWFQFQATKDQALTIACRPFPNDSAAVPLLALVDANGAALAKAGNIENPEHGFTLEWKAPVDGAYRLRLRDLQYGSRGGPEFAYRLTIRPAQPDFALRLETDYVNVVQNGKTDLEVFVDRFGAFTGPIDLTLAGLPADVKVQPTRIAENQTRVKLTVSATDDTRPTDAAVRLMGKAVLADQTIERVAVVPSFGWDNTAVHLTVQHKPVFKLSCHEAYQYAPRGSIHPYLMKIERLGGFDGPIVMQRCDRQVQDLDGADILETIIPPGAKEAMNLVYLPETMHTGVQHHCRPYAQAYATFTDKWGQQQTLLAVSTHRCMIRTTPPVAKLRAVTKEIDAQPGAIALCKMILDRAAFTGPVELDLMETAGFKAEKVTIEAGQTEAVLRVRMDANMPAADGTLTVRATGKLDTGDIVVTEAAIQFHRSEIGAR